MYENTMASRRPLFPTEMLDLSTPFGKIYGNISTLFIDSLAFIDKQTDKSCKSLGGTIASHVQSQASWNMG